MPHALIRGTTYKTRRSDCPGEHRRVRRDPSPGRAQPGVSKPLTRGDAYTLRLAGRRLFERPAPEPVRRRGRGSSFAGAHETDRVLAVRQGERARVQHQCVGIGLGNRRVSSDGVRIGARVSGCAGLQAGV